jgi:hypothetical protein
LATGTTDDIAEGEDNHGYSVRPGAENRNPGPEIRKRSQIRRGGVWRDVARIIHRRDAEIAEKNGLALACAKKLERHIARRLRGLQSYVVLNFSAPSASPR